MKTIYLKALFSIYGIAFLTSILQSCCEEKFMFTTSGEMIAFEGNGDTAVTVVSGDMDTITGDFYLRIYFDHEFQANASNFSLISSTYATSCAHEHINEIDTESFILTTDQEITYEERIISAGDNLLQISTIEQHDFIDGSGSADENSRLLKNYFDFHFTDDFINKSSIMDTVYTFTFNGQTTDGQILRFEKRLWTKN